MKLFKTHVCSFTSYFLLIKTAYTCTNPSRMCIADAHIYDSIVNPTDKGAVNIINLITTQLRNNLNTKVPNFSSVQCNELLSLGVLAFARNCFYRILRIVFLQFSTNNHVAAFQLFSGSLQLHSS